MAKLFRCYAVVRGLASQAAELTFSRNFCGGMGSRNHEYVKDGDIPYRRKQRRIQVGRVCDCLTHGFEATLPLRR